MTTFLSRFSPDSPGGIFRLTILVLIISTLLRAATNPQLVIFQTTKAGEADYAGTIVVSALLIAIDAMLIVLVSWRHLRGWRDTLSVATLVALTHMVFPMVTFGITAGVAWSSQVMGLPAVLAAGAQTAVMVVAFILVFSHLREIHEVARDSEAEFIEPAANVPVMSRAGLAKVGPAVLGVSIDALMVGPSKITLMARYSTPQFFLSFLFIGLLVFALVAGSGLVVLGLKALLGYGKRMETTVRRTDWLGQLLLIAVFIYFSVFAGVYVLYTITQTPLILELWFIVGQATVLFLFYLTFAGAREIVAASRQRNSTTASTPA